MRDRVSDRVCVCVIMVMVCVCVCVCVCSDAVVCKVYILSHDLSKIPIGAQLVSLSTDT